ncbi:MAG: MATE family efflux transporter [Lachnospiraceae bacterium]|nr:MATE family efflux transporter [Lachnospiraceae bacterium]
MRTKELGINKSRETDFTKGSPTKLILSFYWPLLLTSMLQQFYNFADTWIVGKGLGDDALAAVGNMGSLFFLIVGFSFGLANGFGVSVAQSYGAKDMETLKHRVAGVIELGIALAAMLTAFGVAFLPYALRLLNTDELIFADSLKYGYIVFGGLSAGICYNISGAVLRALGDGKTPLKAIMISSIINLSMDSLLIFKFHTGVEGAAIATVCSQIISAGICINRLRKIDIIKPEKAHFSNEWKTFFGLLRNGLPMAFMNSITAVGCMVVQSFVNEIGVVYTAAYAACSKYLNLFMNPASTAGNAMSAYAGQNYGAGEYKRVRDGLFVCLGIAAGVYLILGSVMFLAPEMLAGWLLTGSEQIALACEFLPRCGIMMLFVDVLFVVRSCVQGMGKPMLPMLSGILEMILRIFVISSFIEKTGFRATAYAEISAWIGALLINAFALYIALVPLLSKERHEETRTEQSKIYGHRRRTA